MAPAPSTSRACGHRFLGGRVTCTVIDGRGGAAPVAEFFRLWLASQRELIALWPSGAQQVLPERSIVVLREGHYESILPLAQHTLAALNAAYDQLEEDWVLVPLGLSIGGNSSTLMPEHFSEARQGIAAPRAKGNTSAVPAARRLFAVGEDTALAALRSALTQVANHQSRLVGVGVQMPDEVGSSTPRVEYWTTRPESLIPVADDLARCVPAGVDAVVLVVEPAMNCRGGGASSDADAQSEAKLLFLMEALAGNVTLGASPKIILQRIPLEPTALAKEARAPLDISIPLLLRLPQKALDTEAQRVQICAMPTIVLPMAAYRRLESLKKTMAESMGACDSAFAELEVISVLPSHGVSCELFFGIPVIICSKVVSGSETSSGSADVILATLVHELHRRREGLLLAGKMSPLTLRPHQCKHHFFAVPTPHASFPAALLMVGVAFEDIWNPMAALAFTEDGERAHGCPGDEDSAAQVELQRFDPFLLRGLGRFGRISSH